MDMDSPDEMRMVAVSYCTVCCGVCCMYCIDLSLIHLIPRILKDYITVLYRLFLGAEGLNLGSGVNTDNSLGGCPYRWKQKNQGCQHSRKPSPPLWRP